MNLCEVMRVVGAEPAMILYMFTSFLEYPVFQSLLYEKLCLEQFDSSYCANNSVVHNNKQLQADANHMLLWSNIILTIPSVIVTVVLGAVCDTRNIKIALLIPFVGLIVGDANYLVQTLNMSFDARWLLLSDACFGVCGGYTAIIGTMFAYGARQTLDKKRSVRIAMLEGSIGIGGTVGLALSGVLKEAWGYTNVYIVCIVFHCFTFLYLLLRVNASEFTSEQPTQAVHKSVVTHLRDVIAVWMKKRDGKATLCLRLMLFAFAVEYLAFAGVSDIQYSFLRYKLGWGSLQYGWFSGLGYALTTTTVLTLYPFLKQIPLSDTFLAGFALCCKIVSLIVLAFVVASWMAYSMTILVSFNRFISAGMRSVCSQQVDLSEQGKVMALIGLLEAVITLLASSIFNNFYPWTLDFFAGTSFLVIAALLIIPTVVVLCVHKILLRSPATTVTLTGLTYSKDAAGDGYAG